MHPTKQKLSETSNASVEADAQGDRLDEREEIYRSIFNTAVESIITIDEAGRIQAFNPAAEKLFGYKAEEVIGEDVALLMPSPHAEKHGHYIRQYLETGEAKIIGIGREVEARRKDGSPVPIYLSVSEVRLSDRTLFTGFIQDLTERKEHERQAEQWRRELERRVEQRTAELVRANEDLEHFAFAISHDLRTPLRGIRNYVDFLTEDLAGKIEGESAEDLERLGQAAEELELMIQELLDYSRIGRIDTEPAEVNLNALIGEIAAAESGDGREAVVVGGLPRIFAPPMMIRQIFQNLISNGLHYNRSSPRRVEVSARRAPGDPERWIFAVRDNGIGIDARFHGKIFGVFQRLHSDSEYIGTGIGLASVRKAVQYLGGSIRVESALGEGSAFYVELPARCRMWGDGI